MTDSLLDVIKGLPKEPARGTGTGWTKADHDYVVPTSKEIESGFRDVVALGEIAVARGYEFPFGGAKKALVAALEDIDPAGRIAERATLLRLLKAKGITVDSGASLTADLVHLAMVSGCFGRENKKQVTS